MERDAFIQSAQDHHADCTPGFQSPKWVLNHIPSCDGLFAVLLHHPPAAANCGRVTFEGFTEETDGDQFPLPWDTYYKDQWGIFLQALADKYLSRTELVSISVAGPTAASAEMIVPNSGNMPIQKQFFPGIPANEVWFKLLLWAYQDQSVYLDTDQTFIDAWEDAIDLYGSTFPGITLVLTTGSGLPDFGTPGYETPPPGFGGECGNQTMDCAAEATILSYFAEPDVAPMNAKSSQTSGLEAYRAGDPDLGAVGVRFLSLMTEESTSPSGQILGGMEFNTSFSSNTLKEGCMSEFPPAGNSATCKIKSKCKEQSCIPVECIPENCLAPGKTTADLAKYKTFGEIPAKVKAKDLIPPEQALYNVLQGYFAGTQGSSVFGGVLGDAPLNYLQIYAPDIQYALENCGKDAEVLENEAFVVVPTMVSAETLLRQANVALLGIAEPTPFTPPAATPCVVTLDDGARQTSQSRPVRPSDGESKSGTSDQSLP